MYTILAFCGPQQLYNRAGHEKVKLRESRYDTGPT